MSQKGAENILQTQCSVWRCSCVQNTGLKYGPGLDTGQANLAVTATTQGQFELHKLHLWTGWYTLIYYIKTHHLLLVQLSILKCLVIFYSVHKYQHKTRNDQSTCFPPLNNILKSTLKQEFSIFGPWSHFTVLFAPPGALYAMMRN